MLHYANRAVFKSSNFTRFNTYSIIFPFSALFLARFGFVFRKKCFLIIISERPENDKGVQQAKQQKVYGFQRPRSVRTTLWSTIPC